MNARSLNKLHNTRNKNVAAVTDSVNLNLFTLDVMVNENGAVFINFNRLAKVSAKLIFVSYKLHCSAAKNKAGANEHGIANLCGNLYSVFDFGNSLTLWLGNLKAAKNLFKGISVFGAVNGFCICTDDLYASFCKGLCKVNSSLTTKRCDNTEGTLKLDNVHNVLCGEGFKIEFVRCCVVCRNSFGVVVYNDCLVAAGFDGIHRVNGGIVKLNTLTNTDRTCAEN